MAKQSVKTNAARLLDSAKIDYTLVSYIVDPNDLSAVHVAAQLDEPVEAVYKTLILKGDKSDYFACLIQADKEIDLKKAAKNTGNKSCALIAQKELLPLTGYIRGGCSPLGMKKRMPIYIDQTVDAQPMIYISAGVRGMQLHLKSQDLIDCCQAIIISLTE